MKDMMSMWRTDVISIVAQVMAGIILGITGLSDIRKKRISIRVLAVGGIASGVVWICRFVNSPYELLYGLIPGGIMLGLAAITEEKIGYGDGAILLILGMLLGGSQTLLLLGIGLFLSSIFAIILLITRRFDRKSTFAFVPFLLVGFGISLFV